MNLEYIPSDIEKIAQTYWDKNESFKLKKDKQKKKYYCLSMFPYPSGKLHIGHIRNYTIGDIITRYKNMLGYCVFNPIGWDAFGMPAENAARDNNISPENWTKKNIIAMKNQLKMFGFSFDWTKEIDTSSYKYYKWEQMFFIKLYESGIVYKKNAFINWDPIDNTVLANEQVIDGKGWRSNALIERKKISQWYVSITKYADLLFDGLHKLTEWPQKVKDMQKNWINKKTGYKITLNIENKNCNLKIFLEELFILNDIIFIQASYENEIIDNLNEKAELNCIDKINYLILINPINKNKIPIFISDLNEDCLFFYNKLRKNTLKINDVITIDLGGLKITINKKLINKNSSFSKDNIKIINYLSNKEISLLFFKILNKSNSIKIVNDYNLKDWCISRQRYWGVPIPIIYCNKCGILTEKITRLPIKLPKINKKIYTDISLKKIKNFLNIKCYNCGNLAQRETDTFDTFFESSWYYTKYLCNKSNLNTLKLNSWLPIDQYIGGIEHANLHLIYARFFCKLMKDFNILNCDEPFTKLLTQGMVLKHGSKMSKSKGNIIDQDSLIKKYGADTVRLFVMFLAPPEQSFEWNDNGIIGCKKFLDKIWTLSQNIMTYKMQLSEESMKLYNDDHLRIINFYNETVENIKNNIENRMTFNVVISHIMKITNLLCKFNYYEKTDYYLFKQILESIVILLSPFAPHITHCIWFNIFKKNSDILVEKFPNKIETNNIHTATFKMLVHINGKFKKFLLLDKHFNKNDLLNIIFKDKDLSKFFNNKIIKNVFYKESKLINILIE